MDKPYMLYQKIAANTYLPGHVQPGFRAHLEELTAGSGAALDLLDYASRELDTDKLYFLLRAFLGTQEEEERYTFLSDLEGNFTTGALIKRSYRRVIGVPAKFNQPFSKRNHGMDYFYFLSHLFRVLGYQGWVLLFDEAELMGRLGKKSRAKCYREMQNFLSPPSRLEGVFSLFALSASFAEEVIEKRHELANAEAAFPDDPNAVRAAQATLNAMLDAPELAPLTKPEITQILLGIQDFHGRAYRWEPQVSPEAIYRATEAGGFLLRTKIRAAIEFFDQLFQYGEAGRTRITALGRETFEEEAPELPELDDLSI